MSSPLFRLHDVWMERRHESTSAQMVLCGLSLEIPGDGITCLVGPSGSGKSTLLRLLNRLEEPTRGQVLFRGRDVHRLEVRMLRRAVGMVLQTPIMLPGTVLDNLEAGLRIRDERLAAPSDWLDRVGLKPDLLHKDASNLSGGEKQRVAILRSIVVEPEVLLLDEVTASLDRDSTAQVERLVRSAGIPMIWISHDMAQVVRMADRVFHLQAGQAREGGYP